MHESNDTKHVWLMMLACAVPILILFLLPVLGIKGNYGWAAIVLMVLMHLFLMRGHSGKKKTGHGGCH